MPHDLVGIVLAGGHSVRFGGQKAAARLGGVPLVLHAVERLQPVCRIVAVSCRPGMEAEAIAHAYNLTVLHDLPGDPDGPLAGIHAGLVWAKAQGASGLAVSPCDAPLLPKDLFQRLMDAACDGAAMAETKDGAQPLTGLWPSGALTALETLLAKGGHPSVWQTLDGLGATRVYFDNADAFANLNTRDDLAAAEGRLESRRG